VNRTALQVFIDIDLSRAYYFRARNNFIGPPVTDFENAMLLQATAPAQEIGSSATAYWPVMIFFVVAIVFPVLPIVLGRLLRPINYGKDKMRPYECGIDPTTEAHERFTVRYYIVAMLFLIFDVETIFLLPWAIIFMGDDFSFTKFALIEMFVFIGILIVGYYYAWRKGALEWA
jgi:NADH-quinone oxidoreductase subunit A